MREYANLRYCDLAKKLRMNHTTVHNCEAAERRVDVAEFADWASACELDPMEAFRELFGGRDLRR